MLMSMFPIPVWWLTTWESQNVLSFSNRHILLKTIHHKSVRISFILFFASFSHIFLLFLCFDFSHTQYFYILRYSQWQPEPIGGFSQVSTRQYKHVSASGVCVHPIRRDCFSQDSTRQYKHMCGIGFIPLCSFPYGRLQPGLYKAIRVRILDRNIYLYIFFYFHERFLINRW